MDNSQTEAGTPAAPHAALTVQEAATESRSGTSKIYEELRDGKLKARKFGRRTIILREDFEAWLRSLAEYKSSSPKAAYPP